MRYSLNQDTDRGSVIMHVRIYLRLLCVQGERRSPRLANKLHTHRVKMAHGSTAAGHAGREVESGRDDEITGYANGENTPHVHA